MVATDPLFQGGTEDPYVLLPIVVPGAGTTLKDVQPVLGKEITRLHLEGKVARRACRNPALPNPTSSHASCSQRTRTPPTELDEIHRNIPKLNYNLAKGALHQTG